MERAIGSLDGLKQWGDPPRNCVLCCHWCDQEVPKDAQKATGSLTLTPHMGPRWRIASTPNSFKLHICYVRECGGCIGGLLTPRPVIPCSNSRECTGTPVNLHTQCCNCSACTWFRLVLDAARCPRRVCGRSHLLIDRMNWYIYFANKSIYTTLSTYLPDVIFQ